MIHAISFIQKHLCHHALMSHLVKNVTISVSWLFDSGKRNSEKEWSSLLELVRLPYFDMVKMLVTDPMHTILLGMVQNEVNLCLQNIPESNLAEVYKRIQGIWLPYDIGRLPTNIKDAADGLSGLTAQQWENFACVYARPCFSGLLPEKFFKSLSLLCEILVHITKPVMSEEKLSYGPTYL